MSRAKTNRLFNFDTIIGVSGSGLILLTVSALFLASAANSTVAVATITTTTTTTTTVSTNSLSKADIERAKNYFTDTEMTTHDGENVRFYSDVLDGHIVVINAMYTNCIGACPLVTQKLSQVSRELGDLYGRDVYFVSISIDPEVDTPEILSEFARKQNVNLDGWTFLTGSKQKVDNVVKKIGLYTPRKEEHKALILLGNTRTGRWQKVQPNLPYQAIAAKLKELAGGV